MTFIVCISLDRSNVEVESRCEGKLITIIITIIMITIVVNYYYSNALIIRSYSWIASNYNFIIYNPGLY